MTVLALERYPVELKSVGDFQALLAGMIAAMREQPGLLWADGARALDDDPSYIVLSEWRTAGDVDAWEESETARALTDRFDVFLRGDVTRRRFGS